MKLLQIQKTKNVLPFATSPSSCFGIKCILNILALGHDLVVLLDVLWPTAAQSTENSTIFKHNTLTHPQTPQTRMKPNSTTTNL